MFSNLLRNAVKLTPQGGEIFIRDHSDSRESALQLAAVERFDIVLSDLGLPDGTGWDLMKQLRDRYGIKGIALSGYGMGDDQQRSKDAGFLGHVVKPVDPTQLVAVIERLTSE